MSTQTPVTSPSTPSATKFSRYRSVRKAAAESQTTDGPPPPLPSLNTTAESPRNSVGRGPSRYRRTRPESTPVKAPAPVPTLPAPHSSSGPDDPFQTPPSSRENSYKYERAQDALTGGAGPIPLGREVPGIVSGQRPADHHVSILGGRYGEPLPTNEMHGRHGESPSRRTSQEIQRREAERNEWVQRQKQREVERMQKDLSGIEVPKSPERQVSARDRFAFWKKPQKSPTLPVPSAPKASSDSFGHGEQLGIEPGGGGIVPGIDAPISAVNAGERRVKIKHEETLINLPIDPETTPLDLIHVASASLQKPIDPAASTLLESFTKLGLERPLRRYEHVRDIMNSWDRDTQNGLILVPSAKDGKDEDLEVAAAPKEQPEGDCTVYLHYSQKPGHWNKRWATLRPDGQIQVSKKAGSIDKDLMKICHLSDFDIYTPTAAQVKKLKPPKKHCMAIKSQQRSSMFLSTANFVHFFATDDKQAASQWYKAVQRWRSWYLINKVGVPQRKSLHAGAPNRLTSPPSQHVRQASSARRSASVPRKNIDPDDIPLHQLLSPEHSSTKGLLGETDSIVANPHRLSNREKMPPPTSYPSHMTVDPKRTSMDQPPDPTPQTTFSPTGLLGRTYSQRQQQQREREIASKQPTPFTNRPNLAYGGAVALSGAARPDLPTQTHSRNVSIRSRPDAPPSELYRNSTQRQPAKPLLDFSNPAYREAPQHLKKGRAVVPAQLPPGGLIDVATSPEQANPIPPATSWRRPGQDGGLASGGVRNLYGFRSTSDPFADGDDAFTGLLARAGPSQGGSRQGKGVMTGDRYAKGPMLDLSAPSQYAPGSLLARVETQTSDGGPIIDREKRPETKVRVGEGM